MADGDQGKEHAERDNGEREARDELLADEITRASPRTRRSSCSSSTSRGPWACGRGAGAATGVATSVKTIIIKPCNGPD